MSGSGTRVLAACMTVFLLSLAGVPPMAGFVGKLFLFRAIVDSGRTGLALIAVVNSAVSIYYYLGPIVQMYLGRGSEQPAPLSARPWLVACIAVALAGTLFLGALPAGTLQVAAASFGSLR